MTKINSSYHVTVDGVVKKNPTKVARYRVYWAEPTTWGYSKEDIQFYSTKAGAERALDKMRNNLMDSNVSEGAAVHMEDLLTGFLRGYVVDDSDDRGYQEFGWE